MASFNRLRVGLIGAGGRWGPWAHVPALQGLPETELYAVCTAHADTAQAAADKYGVKHACGDVKALGANPFTITFGHVFDAMCMVVGELAEVSAVVSTQVKQWLETDTKRVVDTTAPDNIMIHGRLGNGAVVCVNVGVQPYHKSGYRLEIYGREGTLMMIGGGEAGQEVNRKIMGGKKDDKEMKELPVPDRLKWVPEEVRKVGRAYDVGQMWVNFAKAIRGGAPVEPDFDHAVRRHRSLDAIVRASETGQRQKVAL